MQVFQRYESYFKKLLFVVSILQRFVTKSFAPSLSYILFCFGFFCALCALPLQFSALCRYPYNLKILPCLLARRYANNTLLHPYFVVLGASHPFEGFKPLHPFEIRLLFLILPPFLRTLQHIFRPCRTLCKVLYTPFRLRFLPFFVPLIM